MPSFRDQGSWPGPNQLNQHWEMPTGHGKYIIHATLSPAEAEAEAETEASLLPHIRLPVTVCWPSQHVSKIPICTKGLRLPLSLLCVLLCVAVCYSVCICECVCVCVCADLSIFCECQSEIRAFIMIRMNYWSIFRLAFPIGLSKLIPRLDSTLPFPSSDHRYSTGVRSVGRCLVTGFSLLLCPVCVICCFWLHFLNCAQTWLTTLQLTAAQVPFWSVYKGIWVP